MAMAGTKIVAEGLTLTGSIGVITGKFNLQRLFERVGYTKEVLSRGKYAELQTDSRGFTEDEQRYFKDSAQFAYESFRDKAALSRGLEIEEMEKYAQGRVWTGTQVNCLLEWCSSCVMLDVAQFLWCDMGWLVARSGTGDRAGGRHWGDVISGGDSKAGSGHCRGRRRLCSRGGRFRWDEGGGGLPSWSGA